MAINFDAIKTRQTTGNLIDPRDIFAALPNKPPEMSFLRGPQDQVLEKWFARRDERDIVAKLNTGSGKTVVGLLMAQSSLAEGKGPAAYFVPDRYLVEQVASEASRLGIRVTTETDFSYTQGKAILIETFQKLFNGLSIFGVAGSVGRQASAVSPSTIVIDDAHACLNKAEQVFKLTIPADEPAYEQFLELFSEDLQQQAPAAYKALASRWSSGVQQVPPWAWSDKSSDALDILADIADRDFAKFTYPLLADVLVTCRAIFTAEGLEIEAPCPPVSSIPAFDQAARRIYLTATLADDAALVTDLDVNPDAVTDPITPANAGDIGDRLILVPEQTHPMAEEDDIREMIVNLAAERNVVVIVPSRHRASYWENDADLVLDKENLRDGVEKLRNNPEIGLVVLINRYDGVDLPGDACHVLVIDGLPEATSGAERIDQAQLSGTESLLARQVQRLEQGMGRATRSADDYCAIILLGRRLAERLHTPQARQHFSPATREQIELSQHVASQLEDTDPQELREAIHQCLNRDPGWIELSRNTLAPLRYPDVGISKVSIASRVAFNSAAERDFNQALSEIQEALDHTSNQTERGHLLQQYASYQHHINPPKAQETQKRANELNRNALKPIGGVTYERLSPPTYEQGAYSSAYLQNRYETANALILGLSSLADALQFSTKAEEFEQAWADLADHIGLRGQRPERDTGRGPDVLWSFPDNTFHVIEAKNEVKGHNTVHKRQAEQVSNSMDWFESMYGRSDNVTPVLIHPSQRFDYQAAVPPNCVVVTSRDVDGLRSNLQALAKGLADKDGFRDATRTGRLLASQGLTTANFLAKYTSSPIHH